MPELLFYPSDIGIKQIGISHAIFHSIQSLPEEIRPHLYSNIVLIGGCAMFPNYRERIEQDIRAMANYLYEVNVYLPNDPVAEAWQGAKSLVNSGVDYTKRAVSRKEYEEKGSLTIITEKIDI